MQTLTHIIHFDKLNIKSTQEMTELISYLDETVRLKLYELLSICKPSIIVSYKGDLNYIYRQPNYTMDCLSLTRQYEYDLYRLTIHIKEYLEKQIDGFCYQPKHKDYYESHCLNFDIIPISNHAVLLTTIILKF